MIFVLAETTVNFGEERNENNKQGQYQNANAQPYTRLLHSGHDASVGQWSERAHRQAVQYWMAASGTHTHHR